MNKVIIPRRDHEVYFLALPGELKPKLVPSYVNDQMDRLHPGFSPASVLDLQHFIFGKERWIMATVMKAEILAEYRILNKKGTLFFTNTSITAHKKEFIQGGINVIDDERIGFDTEKKEPVSIPLEANKNKSFPQLLPELKSIPNRHGIYVKKMPKRRMAAIISSITIMILLTSAFGISRQNNSLITKDTSYFPSPEIIEEPVIEAKFMPSALEILARVSSDVYEAGGKITRWQYNEDAEFLMTIQVRGIRVLKIREICNQLEYAYLEDIRDVRYIDGEPHITIYVDNAKAEYTILESGIFPGQNLSLPMIGELGDALRGQDISIVSEFLPSTANGNMFYTINYTANDRSLIRSLEIIAGICNKYRLWIKNMDVSISGDNNNFDVVCTLAPGDILNPIISQLNGKEEIPAAFGYRDLRLLPVTTITESPKIEVEQPIIGSIRDGYGNQVFFRDTNNGKIQVRVTYD